MPMYFHSTSICQSFNVDSIAPLNKMLIRFRDKAVALSRFGNLYNFSTSTSTPPTPSHLLVNCLVKSLGFSIQEATTTSSKVKSSGKCLKNPNLVLNFLKQTGFDKPQMKKLVSRAPKLLLYDVSRTLKPKFQCLMDLGLSGSELVNVIVRDTTILERGLTTHLRPTIKCLKTTLGSNEAVLKALKRTHWLLSFGAHHIMEANILLLRNCGVPSVKIQKLVLRNPRNITQRTEWVKELLDRVVNDFRIPIDSNIFPYGFHTLASQNKATVERKIRVFKSFGWSDDDVLDMFRKLPYCIAASEVRIRKMLDFYMKELGYGPSYLAFRPSMLSYSLEKRVLPRMEVLKILEEKKLKRRKFALYSVLCLTDSKFKENFVLPYKDQIPDLYESHKNIVAL